MSRMALAKEVKAMEAKGRGVPPVLGLLVRGYAVVASIIALHAAGCLPSVPLAIFLVSVTSISMMFGIGHLLVGAKRPLRKTPLDIPAMAVVYASGGLVMYFITLLAEEGLIADPFVLLTACAFALVIIGVVGYVLEISSNVWCSLSRPPRRRPFRAR